ncbi:MAG: DNA polymerase III subunit beta [Desulfobacterales bacterium]|nr:DNA polymerase III subunit beta [Desulfobacterales bacterium]
MKFKIKKNDIRDVLSKIQGLTGRKSSLSITDNCLIKAVDSSIVIIATDLETGFEGSYPAQIESEGIIALKARKFYEIVKDFPEDEILIKEVENHWIEIGDENVQYHIVGMNPEEFPENPYIDEVALFEVDSASFKKMIEQTIVISPSTDDKRAHTNGIYFERIELQDEKLIRMVSTDGSRLSKADYSYDGDFDLPTGPGIIIPKKGLNEVGKFLDTGGVVQIGVKNNYFIANQGSETIVIRLLEGDFPKYHDIISRDKSCFLIFDKQKFLMMLKRMSILSSENYKGVIFNFGENKLVINSINPEIGESKEEMEIDFDKESIALAFNPKFFIDTLNVIDGDQVVISLIDNESPCYIEEKDKKNFLSVIMPMRI